MPIYEYQCSNCTHAFENIQKLSDPLLTKCPECGQNTLSKLISAAGFQLKGTGWYKTDFRTPSKPAFSTNTENTSTSEKPSTLT